MEENKQTKIEEPQAPQRGERGNVGTPTAAQTIKQLWHSAHFKKVSIENDKGDHIRFDLVQNTGAPSLKRFARLLVGDVSELAKDWLSHKAGSLNAKRTDANIKLAMETGNATKMQKRKKKGDGGAK